ncbi:MAG: HAMP domain-containing histidine kinase [Desulfobacteraceae bacterium]|nr:HAMP domain-containing histidine kinase [Desulfobacteraceae bacterium]
MKYKHSLGFRIIVGFSAMGVILIAVYGFMIYELIKGLEKNFGKNKTSYELELFLNEYNMNKNARLPQTSNLTSYIGIDSLPYNFKTILSGVKNGIYKTGKDGIGGEQGYWIGIGSLPGINKKIFLIHSREQSHIDKRRIQSITFILILVSCAVILLAAGLSFLLSRRVIAPLAQLAKIVENSGPDNLPGKISSLYYDDEVGALARAFEDSMDRIRAFVERERQFTRDASHELRSPLTVIKGALSLLEMKLTENDEKSIEVIQRIERAVASMGNTVECFLWLSREEAGVEPYKNFSVVKIVEQELETCKFIMGKREVMVELIKVCEPEITGPVHVFSIAVSNLIRNAMRYTDRGYVKIIVSKDRVEVSDTGVGIESEKLALMQQLHQKGDESAGFGLGLNIVRRICDRFGWKLIIESKRGRGTKAELYFIKQ